MEQNIQLKKQLNQRAIRGRPDVLTTRCDWRNFENTFLNNDQFVIAWKTLAEKPHNSMRALIVLFFNTVPRFFKLRSLSEIDVNIWLPSLRTSGLERHTLEDFADSIIFAVFSLLEREHENLGFGKLKNLKLRDTLIRTDKTFIFNQLSKSAKRNDGKIRFMNREVSDEHLKIK